MKQSYREALRGFAYCTAGTFVICAAVYISAPFKAQHDVVGVMKSSFYTERQALAFVVESYQSGAIRFFKLLFAMFALYWFTAGLYGKAPMLKLKFANAFLIAGFLCITAQAANGYLYSTNTLCDVLPFPHKGFQISRISECPSSQIFHDSLLRFSATFFLVSLILRLNRFRQNVSTT